MKCNNDTIISVQADKGRLIQVISNLLNNAIKFTEEGIISINIESRQDDGEVIITVKDTGTGIDPEILPIDPEILPKLFLKFATNSHAGGTGLGLYISKSIIEAHGGRIWANINSNGKGAAFYFSLPLAPLLFLPIIVASPMPCRARLMGFLFCSYH